ncbi:MAG TPA: TIR domain-containing protein [Caulobacteraceae bacterium]|nr:TIR domain-containing protein [Caulobacteraceae bacterium]
MSDVFISYARSTAKQAQAVAEALRGLGYSVWIDDDLPAHRTYSRVIEEQMAAAKAAVVIWSADAVQSEWVMSEANRAREDRKLVQVTTDKTRLPMPFDTIQCADLAGWTGDLDAPGWKKAAASIAELVGGVSAQPTPAAPSATPLPLPSKPSIAVLPFANLSGDPEQDYFADGMVAEITMALSRVRSIFVIASGSTLTFKGRAVGPQEAARELGVRFVLEGSVRKAGNRVRIAVQLIDAADGAQLWADRFEDTLEDIFALQDKVALGVTAKIEPTVQAAEMRRAFARPTENMTSYDLYLRALPLYFTFGERGMFEALELLQRAVALDPDHALALSLAAGCHYMIVRYGWSDDPQTHQRQAIEMTHRSLRLAADDANVLIRAALIASDLERDPASAFALAERAIAICPGSASVWGVRGGLWVRAGETDRAIEDLEMSMRLDPMGPARVSQISVMSLARFQQRRFGDAAAHSREMIQHNDAPGAYACLAACYGHLGQIEAARGALHRFRELSRQPIEVFARSVFHAPEHVKLFLDGIALAEGRSPTDSPAAPDS